MRLLDEDRLVIQKSDKEILVMNPADIAKADRNVSTLDLTNGQTLIADCESVDFFAFAEGIL